MDKNKEMMYLCEIEWLRQSIYKLVEDRDKLYKELLKYRAQADYQILGNPMIESRTPMN